MKRVHKVVVVALLALGCAAAAVPARAEEGASLEERLGRIEEKLGLGENRGASVASPEGPFRDAEGGLFGDATSLGAYGEFIYNNVRRATSKDTIEARRIVLFVGHEFSDEWRFFTELEIEHGDEIFVEQGFIDWQPSDYLGLQAGMLLVPAGLVNIVHEPTTFYFAERPRVDNSLIPSTWREVGVQAYGRFGDLSYTLALLNAGTPADELCPGGPADGTNSCSSLDGFATGGVRALRQKGIGAEVNDFAVAGRLQYQPTLGLTIATSGYTGEFDQDSAVGTPPDARMSLWEADAVWRFEGLEARGQYVVVWISDAAALNTWMTSIEPDAVGGVPSRMHGGYIELAYNILPLVLPDTNQRFYIAFRGEWMDLQWKVPGNSAKIGASEQQEYNFGVAWKPVEGVIVKADYQVRKNDAPGDVPNRFNAAVGFSF